jgi:hypothetical protein
VAILLNKLDFPPSPSTTKPTIQYSTWGTTPIQLFSIIFAEWDSDLLRDKNGGNISLVPKEWARGLNLYKKRIPNPTAR